MEFVTLTKSDPEFDSYLLGTFARDQRALPVETFHGRQSGERVTFQLVSVGDIDVPPWWRVYLASCRPELASLTLGPSVLAWLNHSQALQDWTRWPSWLALLGIFFLHTAAFLFNDYQDHLRGADRLNRRRGSQVIQKGWVTAWKMRRWAWVNAGCALLCGLPAFWHSPGPIALLAGSAACMVLLVLHKAGQRWGLTDVALALIFGPLLTAGVAVASFGRVLLADVALGAACGVWALWVFHVRQFESMFRIQPEMFRTWLGRLPFDRAQTFVIFAAGFVVLIQLLVAYFFARPAGLWWLWPVAFWPMLWTAVQILRATSPLASTLLGVSRVALGAHIMGMAWWALVLSRPWWELYL